MTSERKRPRGLVQVYTGDGKGKTTAALGQAMRAAGQGLKVIFIQFVKGKDDCGEHRFVKTYPAFRIVQPAKGDAFSRSKELLKSEAQETLATAESAVTGNEYDLVVLDEILMAVRDGLLTVEQVTGLIEKKPAQVELVLTGRGAPPEVVKMADLVTEMLMIKHPWTSGVPGRRGIEF